MTRRNFEVVFEGKPPVVVCAVDKNSAKCLAALEAFPGSTVTHALAAYAQSVKVAGKVARIVR